MNAKPDQSKPTVGELWRRSWDEPGKQFYTEWKVLNVGESRVHVFAKGYVQSVPLEWFTDGGSWVKV